jgi:SAM-dependent methyltransferase
MRVDKMKSANTEFTVETGGHGFTNVNDRALSLKSVPSVLEQLVGMTTVVRQFRPTVIMSHHLARRSDVRTQRGVFRLLTAFHLIWLTAATAAAQQAQAPFEPQVGQAGKDVVWVPTPDVLVEKMLDMAQITPADFVMDLGSGDGRNVIAAAKRGARALGVEYNPQMVELSRRNAERAGVADKAKFVEGDMYEADISQATVLALFLLPTNLERLAPKFLDMKPGTRIVDNTFAIPGWEPDATEKIESDDCATWCTSLLWIVPAKIEGTWRSASAELTFDQEYQMFTGTLSAGGNAAAIQDGRLRGDQITFRAGGAEYTGRVIGDTMEGTVRSGGTERPWTAARAR